MRRATVRPLQTGPRSRRCEHAEIVGVKRERQYEHVKESEEQRDRSDKTAKRIAAATVNKTRREKGEAKRES